MVKTNYGGIIVWRGEDRMPRLAREYLESCFYHIITQGINREYIFEGEYAKELYKSLIKKNIEGTDIQILAYCIMDNHAHILIHVKKTEEMTKLMRKTNTSYGMLYNRMKKRVGYVFRDRYYTQVIKNERQLLNCLVYIHNNPIKANIVNKIGSYKYSSYSEYIGKKDLITNEGIKLIFGGSKNYKEIEYVSLLDIHYCFVASKEYISYFSKIFKDDPDYFANGNILLLDKKNTTRDYIDKIFDTHKIIPRQIMEVNNTETMIDFAKNGVGIACVVEEFIQDELDKKQLVKLPIKFKIPKYSVGYAYNKTNISKELSDFLNVINTGKKSK